MWDNLLWCSRHRANKHSLKPVCQLMSVRCLCVQCFNGKKDECTLDNRLLTCHSETLLLAFWIVVYLLVYKQPAHGSSSCPWVPSEINLNQFPTHNQITPYQLWFHDCPKLIWSMVLISSVLLATNLGLVFQRYSNVKITERGRQHVRHSSI